MGRHTEIQWADSTVNLSTGCDGCELWKVNVGGPCYAGNYHETRMAKALPALYAPNFDEVRLAPGRMAKAAAWTDLRGKPRPGKPWLDGLPRMVFVGDMADIFSRDVPFDYLKSELIDVATSPKGSRHIWMLLTKQPSRMAKFSAWLVDQGIAWPDNVWAGTSITTQKTTRRIDHLLNVSTRYRFLSVEPQREFIDLDRWIYDGGILLVIQGGESDQGNYTGHPFDVIWVRSIRDSCKDANVYYFLKQFGSHPCTIRDLRSDGQEPGLPQNLINCELNLRDSHGGDWDEWPSEFCVRQMPNVEATSHACPPTLRGRRRAAPRRDLCPAGRVRPPCHRRACE